MTTLLPISLQNSLCEIIDQSNLRGATICAILLSTTEGVPLGRVVVDEVMQQQREESSHNNNNNNYKKMNIDVLASIESVWAPASKQFPVLGLEKLKQVTAIYDHGTLIHIYQAPMVITILCGPHSNLGAVRSTAIPLLKLALGPLSQELVNSLQPDTNNNSIPVAAYYG